MTAHQGQFLSGGDQFHCKCPNIGFVDHKPASRSEHSPEFFRRLALVADMMESIYHDNPRERLSGKGSLSDCEHTGYKAGFLRVSASILQERSATTIGSAFPRRNCATRPVPPPASSNAPETGRPTSAHKSCGSAGG